MNVTAPVSIGELLDKITILDIKCEKISDPSKLDNVRHERELLQTTWQTLNKSDTEIEQLLKALRSVNQKLWDIEDKLRLKEGQSSFDDEFIQLARAVYFTNDERADLKRQINQHLGSELVEEKSYADYR